MTLVVMLLVAVVSSGGGGGGGIAPGQFTWPANAEADSSTVSTATAQDWRKVFIVRKPPSCEVKILHRQLEQLWIFLARAGLTA